MRIISGKYKGFRLPPVKLSNTRPTTDRTKEALFNILQSQMDFDGLTVLDLYTGTGGIGLEFFSRGAKEVVFVDKNPASLAYIKSVLQMLKINGELVKKSVETFVKNCTQKFDIIFADPPYADNTILTLVNNIFDKNLLNEGGVFVLEHQHKLDISHKFLTETRNYGQSSFSFFIFEVEKR
jgi:16S rRNA (guanine(966)-N(2))-methyltransferase RsmD